MGKTKITRLTLSVVTAVALGLVAYSAQATLRCENSNLLGTKLITDICWRCIFPMKMAGATINPFTATTDGGSDSSGNSGSTSSDGNNGQDSDSDGDSKDSKDKDDKSSWSSDLAQWLGSGIKQIIGNGEEVPEGAVDQPVCMCFDDAGMPQPGIVTSFWEPYRLVEHETVPGCMAALNGTKLNINESNLGSQGGSEISAPDRVRFNHYHYYSFPLIHMLELFSGKGCNPGGYSDFDLMYMSEIDPTWNTPEISFFSNPEAALFANPAAAVACMPDAVSSAVNHPINQLFWCAGTWGMVYPLAGDMNERMGILKGTALATVRILTQIHRRGFAYGTMGADALCGGKIAPYFPKAQYKFTLAYPIAETQSSHKTGTLVEGWGAGKLRPGESEEPIYLVWRWLDCCNRL